MAIMASNGEDEAGNEALVDGGRLEAEEVRSNPDIEDSKSVAETLPVVDD